MGDVFGCVSAYRRHDSVDLIKKKSIEWSTHKYAVQTNILCGNNDW